MADQNVVILGGSGNVGREFPSQVIQHDTVFSNKHLNPTNIIALTNSKGFWFNKQGLEIQKNPEKVGGRSLLSKRNAGQGERGFSFIQQETLPLRQLHKGTF